MSKTLKVAGIEMLDNVLGEARFTEKQLASANYGGSAKLRTDYLYILPAQRVIELRIPEFNGHTTSKQVVALAYREGNLEAIIGLTWSSLNAIHVGRIESGAPAPEIEIILDHGKRKLADSSLYESIWQAGNLPTSGDGNTISITKTTCIEVVERSACWQVQLIQNTHGEWVPAGQPENPNLALLKGKKLPILRSMISVPDFVQESLWPTELKDHLAKFKPVERPVEGAEVSRKKALKKQGLHHPGWSQERFDSSPWIC